MLSGPADVTERVAMACDTASLMRLCASCRDARAACSTVRPWARHLRSVVEVARGDGAVLAPVPRFGRDLRVRALLVVVESTGGDARAACRALDLDPIRLVPRLVACIRDNMTALKREVQKHYCLLAMAARATTRSNPLHSAWGRVAHICYCQRDHLRAAAAAVERCRRLAAQLENTADRHAGVVQARTRSPTGRADAAWTLRRMPRRLRALALNMETALLMLRD
jgi:hypothetical protein